MARSTTAPPVRIAVVSTPRSGNCWIRQLLADSYRVDSIARHALDDADWAALPAECVLQLHWPREPAFAARLAAEGFRVVTIARHPFDVLLSILHVAVHDVQSERWLGGIHGDEAPIWGAWPRHPAFLEYAVGPRAAALLAVTRDWWDAPGVLRVRYEDAVADTPTTLAALIRLLGPPRVAEVDEVVARHAFRNLGKHTVNNHYWVGRPGLWRALLPPAEANRLSDPHRDHLAALGYSAEPDPDLTPDAADRLWLALTGPELGQTLRRNTEAFVHVLEETRRHAHEVAEQGRLQAEASNARAAESEARAAESVAEAARLAAELADLRHALDEAEAALAAYRVLDGHPIRLARRYRDFSARHPRLARPLAAWLADSDAA